MDVVANNKDACLLIDGKRAEFVPGHLRMVIARSAILLAGQIEGCFDVILPGSRAMHGEPGDYLVVDGERMAIVPRIAFGELFEVPNVAD